MTAVVAPADTLGQAWINTLQAVNSVGGTAVNTVTTLTNPGVEDLATRAIVDGLLVPGRRSGGSPAQTVNTVANTLFPAALYQSPPRPWSPDDEAGGQALDAAAAAVYEQYTDMLPMLHTANGNSRGTYFERMISWPAPDGTDVNQLKDRIHYLRQARRRNHRSNNVADVAVAFDACPAAGVQVYASDDRRARGFPCLVHIDLSVHDGRLHMLAVYRTWHLVTKAYGNMLGLSRLLAFLSEQTGYPVGELAVVAGTADCERGHREIDRIIAEAALVPAP